MLTCFQSRMKPVLILFLRVGPSFFLTPPSIKVLSFVMFSRDVAFPSCSSLQIAFTLANPEFCMYVGLYELLLRIVQHLL
jgi:hypothetical protein